MNEKQYKEYSVLERIPEQGEKCLCFGHRTFCCKEDMEIEAKWHEVFFHIEISEYKIKPTFPDDIEDSIFQHCVVQETWKIYKSKDHPDDRVIGVTKWKKNKMPQ